MKYLIALVMFVGIAFILSKKAVKTDGELSALPFSSGVELQAETESLLADNFVKTNEQEDREPGLSGTQVAHWVEELKYIDPYSRESEKRLARLRQLPDGHYWTAQVAEAWSETEGNLEPVLDLVLDGALITTKLESYFQHQLDVNQNPEITLAILSLNLEPTDQVASVVEQIFLTDTQLENRIRAFAWLSRNQAFPEDIIYSALMDDNPEMVYAALARLIDQPEILRPNSNSLGNLIAFLPVIEQWSVDSNHRYSGTASQLLLRIKKMNEENETQREL